MFRLFEDERLAATEPLRAAMRDLNRKAISPAKREVINAAITYFIDRIENDNIIRIATTDYNSRLTQLQQLVTATNLNDDAFLAEVRMIAGRLPEGSALKTSLGQTITRAQTTLTARREAATTVSIAVAVGATAVLLLTNPRAGLVVLAVELLATINPAPVKAVFNDVLESLDSLLSTEYNNNANRQQPQQQALPAYRN